MWEALTGRRLYKAMNEWGQPKRDFDVDPPSMHNPDCSVYLDDIVLNAVKQEPEDRWQSAAAMHRALAHVASGLAATASEVVRAKQSLRPETAHDPYAGFSIEIEFEDYDEEEKRPSLGEGMGRWWPAEPATEPKLRVEGSSVWPVEPPTSPDFGNDPGTVPSAPRFSESKITNKLPTRKPPAPEPPTEPRKPMPKKPRATSARTRPEKAVPPPVPKRNTVRKPAPGTTDSPYDTLETEVGDRDDTKSFSSEADTVEGKRFDDE
jgi:hypothetical protein